MEAHPVQEVTERLPILAVFARRSVVEARPETYKLVEVASEEVAWFKVRAWRVVEPETRKEEFTVEEASERKPL